MRRISPAPFALLLLALPAFAVAQSTAGIQPVLSARARVESWDWFDAGPEGRYDYLGVTVRAGLTQQRARFAWRAEVAIPMLFGLPDDATLPGSAGQLGVGASYFAASGRERNVVNVLPRQLWIRVGRPAEGPALTVGRLDFSDGAERVPGDRTLATLRAQRIAQRLVGTFGFTHVQRSFDGAQFVFNGRGQQFTAAALRPTPGAFAANGSSALDVDLGYAAWSRDVSMGQTKGDIRLFGLYSADHRDVVLTDSRPLAARQADRGHASVMTWGGHWLQVTPMSVGPVDLLAWGVVQRGTWGALAQRSAALALEAGLQPAGVRGKPWIRVGAFHGTGDRNASDARHETFYQVIPTPRGYARFPFYNLMNRDEVFAHLLLRPHARWTVQFNVHDLRLSQAADLWYLGGGAFESSSFGFAGRPSGGSRALARVADAAVTYLPTRRWALELYAAAASGGRVIESIYPAGGSGRLLFAESRFTW